MLHEWQTWKKMWTVAKRWSTYGWSWRWRYTWQALTWEPRQQGGSAVTLPSPKPACPPGECNKRCFPPSRTCWAQLIQFRVSNSRASLFVLLTSEPSSEHLWAEFFWCTKACLLLSSLQAVKIRPNVHVSGNVHVGMRQASVRVAQEKRSEKQLNFSWNATRLRYIIKWTISYTYTQKHAYTHTHTQNPLLVGPDVEPCWIDKKWFRADAFQQLAALCLP